MNAENAAQARVGSGGLLAWVRLWRFHFVPLSLSAGIVGMSAPSSGRTMPSLVVSLLICTFGYGVGVVINDWFDRKADAVNSPDRPFVAGLVNPNFALGVTLGMATVLFVLAIIIAPPVAIWSAVAIAGHFVYTWTKGIPMVGNIANGADLAVFTLIGMAGVRPAAGWLGIPRSTVLQFVLVAAVLSGFCLVGYFKDVKGDRIAGYRTLPVAIGPVWASRIAPVFPVLAVGVLAVLSGVRPALLGGTANTTFLALVVLSLAAFVMSLIKLISAPERLSYEALIWYTRAATLFILALAARTWSLNLLWVAVPMMVYLELTLRTTRNSRQA
jgi:geranylgeranylglycerol-phosphate geranylgeranyltransferase